MFSNFRATSWSSKITIGNLDDWFPWNNGWTADKRGWSLYLKHLPGNDWETGKTAHVSQTVGFHGRLIPNGPSGISFPTEQGAFWGSGMDISHVEQPQV